MNIKSIRGGRGVKEKGLTIDVRLWLLYDLAMILLGGLSRGLVYVHLCNSFLEESLDY